MGSVSQHHGSLTDIGDEIMIYLHVLRTDADLIFKIPLVLVECEVLVDILDIRICLVRRVVAFRLLVTIGRVALRHVNALVALQNAGFAVVQVTASEVVVVVVGGVCRPSGTYAVTDSNVRQEVRVSGIVALLFVCQTIQSHVLLGSGSTGRGKGVGLAGLHGYLTPLCISEVRRAVDRHATLIELLTVMEDVLADLAEVDVQIATIFASISLPGRINKGV